MTKRNPILTREWLRQNHVIAGTRIAELAKMAGCSTNCVRQALDRHGLRRRDERGGAVHTSRRSTFDIAEAAQLYLTGSMACNDIGLRLGVSGCTIRRRLREANISIRHHNDTKRGAKARNRIELDADLVIRQYLMPGATCKTVGRTHGVSGHVVARILSEAGVETKPADPNRYTGNRNPNWRADLTDAERESRRDTARQAKWRGKVFERDSYTCRCCGDAKGGNLQAHHVKDHATNKADRWSVDNGMTLCAPCHRAFHRAYGLTGVNRAMLDDFIGGGEQTALAA